MAHNRYLKSIITDFLEEKMVFLGGPRQVGKTTLCLQFLNPPDVKNIAYLNWDTIEGREKLKNGRLPASDILVIDEIHKFKLWRRLIKGFYDGNKGHQNYLVIGSARLDFYRKGGDSLLGRYRYLRLHPLSVAELGLNNSNDVKNLLHFGGFPEPFFSQSERKHKLWMKERAYRVTHDDVGGLEKLNELTRMELLIDNLNPRISSLLSLKSLEEDIQASQKTIAHWVEILERVYYIFRIYPLVSNQLRVIKKMPKIYFWDWGSVENQGARFENMVASHLLKYCHFLEDSEGEKMEIRFFKDSDGREVDFIVLKNKKPIFAVECKTGEKQASKSLIYFKQKFKIQAVYQTHLGSADYITKEGIRVIPFHQLSNELNLV